tara:strand:+ start:818 stop:1045 length:228 start_codon:yes stop_codon:yes gene_type:complete
MELFKKVFKSLFKIMLTTSIAVVTFIVDILILVEDILEKLDTKLYPLPSVIDKKCMNKMVREYNERINSKKINVD